jgi:hypothetical protein
MKKLKIVSDGTTLGTHIVDEESGEEIGYVTELTVHAVIGDPVVTAELKLAKVKLELTGVEKI